MNNEIEIYVCTEEASEPKPFKVELNLTVEDFLKLLSPDHHHELCLTLSGEDAPRDPNHRFHDIGIHQGDFVHCHHHKKTEHHRHEHRVEVIVNGKPVEVKYVPQERGKILVERALKKSNNSGQDPEKWQLRDEHGTNLDQTKHFWEYKLTKHAKLFLNLIAGGGGGVE